MADDYYNIFNPVGGSSGGGWDQSQAQPTVDPMIEAERRRRLQEATKLQPGGWGDTALNAAGTVASPVMSVLHTFDKPRNAIATATMQGLSADPNKTFLGGLGEGWKQKNDVSWGDVAGIPAPQATDSWGRWLGLGASRLALDVVGDPSHVVNWSSG